jgi:transcriptional regulator with XRE-family HTH domain
MRPSKTIPSADKLKKIAETLNVSADYLLFDNVPQSGRVEVSDPELLEKFTIIDKMGDQDRDTIKSVLDAMILKNQVLGLVEHGAKVPVHSNA